jgi:group I intron endonuclease
MCKSGVYQIILKNDGRSYVGSAVDIIDRWKAHINNAKNKNLKIKQVISKAIKKYGSENFDWNILELCEVDQLIDREQYWLDTIRPFADENNGFNIRKIADSNFGIKRTLESKQKQSKTMTGVLKTEKHKQHMRDSWHNTRGEEYYAQLSIRMQGDNNPSKRPEVAEKISKSKLGKGWKDDTIRVEKHIAARKGKKYSEEAKANMKIAQQKNNTRSAVAKEKFYLLQRTLYEITKPDNSTFQMYSRELKEYCKSNSLQYSNLITTANTNKIYKKGWKARRLS